MRNAARSSAAGFSLLELVVSLGLFSVVLAMVFTFLDQARRNLETESGGLETQAAARVALEELVFHAKHAGYGIDRRDRSNPAAWQRAVVHAGSHALVFNADLDPALGALRDSVTLEFPDGSRYTGEATTDSTKGAETYDYTLDADGDGRISAADRTAVPNGGHNPAQATENPLDYALMRRVHGYDGTGQGGAPVGVTPYLFTNATADDDYPDRTSPHPLFSYWLTEDLDGDGALAPGECVVAPCPPAAPREPVVYLWGDSNFDGQLSESEKDALRELPVGAAGWAANPLADTGELRRTRLASAVLPGDRIVEVSDATGFLVGAEVELGHGDAAERTGVASVDMGVVPNRIALTSAARLDHDLAEPLRMLPDTLLRAIRTVELHFDAITPRADYDSERAGSVPGRAGRVGTRGLGHRVQSFERRLGVDNLRTRPLNAS